MTVEEKSLRDFMCRLLPLMQHPALSKGLFYGLNWANADTPGYGRREGETASGHRMYAFLRHNRKARATVLAVCNLDTEHEAVTHVHIPAHAIEWAGHRGEQCRFRHLLDTQLADVECSCEKLQTVGLPITLPPGGAVLLEWT